MYKEKKLMNIEKRKLLSLLYYSAPVLFIDRHELQCISINITIISVDVFNNHLSLKSELNCSVYHPSVGISLGWSESNVCVWGRGGGVSVKSVKTIELNT